jgi:hypothetical protein
MKTKRTLLLSLMSAALLLGACDDPIPSIETERFMYLFLTGAKEIPSVKKLNLENTADTVFYIIMAYGGTTNYEQGDISATLAADLSLVETFNTANNTAYRPLPEAARSFDKTELRITNGKNRSEEPIKLTIRINALDLSSDYLLPVTVRSVSGSLPLNEEMKTLYLLFQGDVDENKDKNLWHTSGASSYWQTYTAALAFDGDSYTYWHSDLDGSLPQWFAVNMEGFKRIDGFTWVNRSDPGQEALPKHVKIETSMNGTEWTEALDIPEMDKSRVMQVLPLESTVVAKYFRVTVLSAWNDAPYTYVGEVDIYSGEEPEPEREIEWAKNTWEIVDYSSDWRANNDIWNVASTIDGDIGRSWHTDPTGSLPQWFIIDLKQSFMIRGFLLWNRQEDHGSEPKNIVFETSNDGTTDWRVLLDEPEMSTAYNHELDLPATNPQRGRYLRVTVKSNWSGYGFTYIAELTLY